MRRALIFRVTFFFFAWPAEYLAFSLHYFSPVAQLGHVPGGTSASRVARQRSDMIAAFDELSSHLHMPFLGALDYSCSKQSQTHIGVLRRCD